MRWIASGFTANIDAITSLTPALLSKIKKFCGSEISQDVSKDSLLSSWCDLYSILYQHLSKGGGGEYVIVNQKILEELSSFNDWSWAVGGTGLQSACSLAAAGHPCLVNLPSWSSKYNSLIQYNHLIPVFEESSSIVPVHYIIEYVYNNSIAGKNEPNRIILRGMNEFSKGIIVPTFSERIRNFQENIHWLLLSGFNALDSLEEFQILLYQTIEFLQSLGINRSPAHLELAGHMSLKLQRQLIHSLGPYIQSIGMNEDELTELLEINQPLLTLPDYKLQEILLRAYQEFKIPILIVHTSEFAAAVSSQNISEWEKALKTGIQFATAKAYYSRFCSAKEIEELSGQLKQSSRGERIKQFATGSLCIVPSYEIVPTRAVGLGDAFVAGLLANAPNRKITGRQ